MSVSLVHLRKQCSDSDSKLALQLSMYSILVCPGILVGVIQDVSEIELVVAVHVHVQAEHRGAIATEAAGLRQDVALHHKAHGQVRPVED